jgi:hypothetical protein
LAAQETIAELFVRLPDAEAEGLSQAARQSLVERSGAAISYAAPSREGFWLESAPPNALTLYGIHRSPVVYKLFIGRAGFPDLLAICRSRQTSGPASSDERLSPGPFLDLALYQKGIDLSLIKAQMEDFIPPIGVFDFVTAETVQDAQARHDLSVIDQSFGACLTCHASVEDKAALDILTVTALNAHSCAGLLAQFKLLPLAWNGEFFEKPYDRAVPPDQPWPRRTAPPRGLYYNPPSY